MKIFISAGHNPAKKGDSGVVVGHSVEAIMVDEISRLIHENLSIAEYDSILVPNTLTLAGEIEWINKRAKVDDIALQYHLNSHKSPDVRGTETFYYRNQILAEIFARHISKALGIPNNGYKPDEQSYLGELGFVRKTKCKAVLIEACFLTNADDVKALDYNKIVAGTLNAIREIDTPKIIVADAPKKVRVLTVDEKQKISVLHVWLDLLKVKLSFLKLKNKKLGAIEKPANDRSLTQRANIITAVISILALFGIYITEANINGFLVIVGAIGALVSSIVSYYGRWRVGDLTFSGLRKK